MAAATGGLPALSHVKVKKRPTGLKVSRGSLGVSSPASQTDGHDAAALALLIGFRFGSGLIDFAPGDHAEALRDPVKFESAGATHYRVLP